MSTVMGTILGTVFEATRARVKAPSCRDARAAHIKVGHIGSSPTQHTRKRAPG